MLRRFTPLLALAVVALVAAFILMGDMSTDQRAQVGGSSLSVTSLTLVNASTDTDIQTIDPDGDGFHTVDLATVGATSFNIRADVTADVSSVRFDLDGAIYRTENVAPYAFAGDASGDYNNWAPGEGTYVITVNPFGGSDASGVSGTPVTIELTFADGIVIPPVSSDPEVTSIELFDADSDTSLGIITDGDTIAYDPATETRAIVVNANSATESVRMVLDGGGTYRIESEAPYALDGDLAGPDYNPWTLSLGTHTLTATPYSADSAGGAAGTSVTISFTIEEGDGGSVTPPSVLGTPTGLVGEATNLGTIRLDWNDVSGATGYVVYRNGVEVASTVLSQYADTGLTLSTNYSYAVSATNGTDESPRSSSITIASNPPSVSTAFSIGDRVRTTSVLNARVRSGADASLLGAVPAGAEGTITGGPSDVGTFTWWEVSYDAGIVPAPGVTDPGSEGWSAENWLEPIPTSGTDTTPPSVPTGLTTVGTIGSDMVTLDWNPSTDASGIANYRVYRDGTYDGLATTTSYTDTLLSPTTTYSYQVSAVDTAGNESDLSAPLSVTTSSGTGTTGSFSIGERVQVTVPVLNVRTGPTTSAALVGTVSLGQIGTITGGPSFADGYEWYLVDFETGPTGWIAIEFTSQISTDIDEVGPTWPGATPLTVMLMGTPDTPMIQLTWDGAIDPSGIGSYRVYRGDGTPVDYGITDTMTMRPAVPSTTYSFYVVAYDNLLNESVPSNTVTITTGDAVTTGGGDGNWNDPSVWPSGSVPGPGDDVLITDAMEIVVDDDVTGLGEVFVYGELRFADTDIFFQAENIIVLGDGALEIGTEASPIVNDITIELTANPAKGFDGVTPNKIISVGADGSSGNARIDMHGIRAQSIQWTQLVPLSGEPGYADGGYAAGADRLKFADNVTAGSQPWRVGDELGIAATFFADDGQGEVLIDKHESEIVTITAVNPDGTVSITPPLQHYHHASIETVSGGGESASIDMRAEVGLLTRNIKVIGDVDDVQDFTMNVGGEVTDRLPADNDAFGAQIMIMAGASHAKIQGVEVRNGGQLGQPGRYPLHYHFAGDMTGSYMSRNSIVKSNQRCIVVHGTNNVVLEENVAYENWNHCYSIEDGGEVGNRLVRNLSINLKHPHPYGPGGLDGSDAISGMNWHSFPCSGCTARNGSRIIGRSFQDERHAAAFWISNPNNYVVGNRAAGGMGMGFMYDVGEKPYANYNNPSLGNDDRYDVTNSPYVMDASDGAVFRDNAAHSFADWGSFATGTTNFSDRSDYITAGLGFFVDDMLVSEDDADGLMIFEDFETYGNEVMGVWIESRPTVVRNFTVAESGSGFNVYRSQIQDSVFIGDDAIDILDMNRDYGAVNVASGTDQFHSEKEPIIDGLTIFEQNGSPAIFVQGRKPNEGGGPPEPQRVGVLSFMKDLQFINSSAPKFQYQQDAVYAAMADVSGDIVGTPSFLVSRDYHSCTFNSSVNAKTCPLSSWTALNVYTDFYNDVQVGNITLSPAAGGATRTMFKTDTFDASWYPAYDQERSELLPANTEYRLSFTSGVPSTPVNYHFKAYNSDRGHILTIRNMFSAPSSITIDGSSIPSVASKSALGYTADGYYYDAVANELSVAVELDSGTGREAILRVTP